MKNYISINGQKTELTPEQLEKLRASFATPATKLSDIPEGGVFKIAGHEMVVLEHRGYSALVIRKDLLPDQTFGDNNNFSESKVAETCDKFAEEIASAVGAQNITTHDLDLTADDGLKDYGIMKGRKASLLTADMYRKYVCTLNMFKPDSWWWLATPTSAPTHSNDFWVKCVSPSGYLDDGVYYRDFGVRPFCILKSNIFVSI